MRNCIFFITVIPHSLVAFHSLNNCVVCGCRYIGSSQGLLCPSPVSVAWWQWVGFMSPLALTHSHFRSLFLTRESPGPKPLPCQLCRLAGPLGTPLTIPAWPPRSWHLAVAQTNAVSTSPPGSHPPHSSLQRLLPSLSLSSPTSRCLRQRLLSPPPLGLKLQAAV